MGRHFRSFGGIALGVLWLLPAIAFCAAAKVDIVVQTGHSSGVFLVAFSPDGRYIATAGGNTAILWDIPTGQQVRTFAGHQDGVHSLSFSPNGRQIATGSSDKTAILWDVATGRPIHTFAEHKGLVKSVAFSPDGRQLATGSYDEKVILWDIANGRPNLTLTVPSLVTSVMFSPNGEQIAAGSSDKTAILWNAVTGAPIRTFAGHKDTVWAVAISPNGKQILTGSSDKEAILWDIATGRQIQKLTGHTAEVKAVAFRPDGKQILTGSDDRSAATWDPATGRPVHVWTGAQTVWSVAFSPDGKQILLGALDPTVFLYDAATGRPIREFAGRVSGLQFAAHSPTGNYIVTGTANQATVWDIAPGGQVRSLSGHNAKFDVVAISPDGKQIISGARDNGAVQWDVASGQRIRTLVGHRDTIDSIAFSSDGRQVATGSRDRTAILWDAATGQRVRVLTGGTMGNNVAFSPDGGQLLYGHVLWDAITGAELRTLEGHKYIIFSGVFSPDGKQIATASGDTTAIIWYAASGKPILTLAGHNKYVMSAAFSPSGKLVVTASLDNTAILWDAASGRQIHTLANHTGMVLSAGFSADGKKVITCSADGTTRIWETATGQELCRLIRFNTDADWLVVTPDGFFDGSVNAPKYVAFREEGTNNLVPLERYQHRYYKPGLLAMLMKGEAPKPAVKIAEAPPPRVRIIAPAKAGAELTTATFEVQAEAESAGKQPVMALRLLVDHRPYRGQLGVHKVDELKLGIVKASWSVEFDPGRHTLQVLADTELCQGASDEIEIKYVGATTSPADSIQLPNLYVLAIGISKYPGDRKLDYAAADAQAIAEGYGKHCKPLFKQVEIKLLVDEQATRQGILDGLDWLRKNMTQRDYGVFFFAGHGEKDADGSLYFLPVDMKEDQLLATGVFADQLKRTLAGMPGKLTAILDACHSGGIDAGKRRGGRGLTDDLMRDLIAEESGLVVMCSATGSEFAQESHEHRHGMFTVAFLEGISGKAANKEGVVYLNELDAYITNRVKELSKGRQHPVTGKPTSLRSFPVAKP